MGIKTATLCRLKDETFTRRITIYGTTYWFGLFCHTYTAKKISHVGLSDEYEHLAQSPRRAGPAARTCFSRHHARSLSPWPSRRCAPVFHANPNSRPASVPAALSGFFLGFSPSGSVPTRAGAGARGGRARGAPRRGSRAARVLRRDRTNQPPILSRDRRFRPALDPPVVIVTSSPFR